MSTRSAAKKWGRTGELGTIMDAITEAANELRDRLLATPGLIATLFAPAGWLRQFVLGRQFQQRGFDRRLPRREQGNAKNPIYFAVPGALKFPRRERCSICGAHEQ